MSQQCVRPFPEATSQVGPITAPGAHEGGRFCDVGLKSDDYKVGVSGFSFLRGFIIAVLVGAVVLTVASLRGMVWNGALDHEGYTRASANVPAPADEVKVVQAPLVDREAPMAAATKGLHPASLVRFSRTTATSE